MTCEDRLYHRQREEHCRAQAALASDADIRRRHEQLAELHADRASRLDATVN